MPKEAINLKQIKKQNSTRLEKLLSNPKSNPHILFILKSTLHALILYQNLF